MLFFGPKIASVTRECTWSFTEQTVREHLQPLSGEDQESESASALSPQLCSPYRPSAPNEVQNGTLSAPGNRVARMYKYVQVAVGLLRGEEEKQQ